MVNFSVNFENKNAKLHDFKKEIVTQCLAVNGNAVFSRSMFLHPAVKYSVTASVYTKKQYTNHRSFFHERSSFIRNNVHHQRSVGR